MQIFRGLAMIAQDVDFCAQVRIVGRDRACFPKRAEVFPGIETETTGYSHAACFSAFVTGPMCLAGIFDNRSAAMARNSEDFVHRCGLAEKMNRNNGLSAQ